MVLFKTEDLSFSYPLSDKKALNRVTLEINSGEFILLMGKSAGGKSTLLRLLKEEIAPTGVVQGKIERFCDDTGFVFQNVKSSFVSERVRGELAFSLENKAYSNDEISIKIGEIASFFNIADRLDCEISKLSGGERALVACAAAMAGDVKALILDEPFSQLDSKASAMLISMLKRINGELGVTVIVSSHTSDSLIDICDRLLVLDNGTLICDSTPQKAVENSSLLEFFPVCTRLFEQRPLNVRDALKYTGNLKEKPLVIPDKAQACVKLKSICFAYSKNSRNVLNCLSYEAYKGKINTVIGSNASGKTTLLKVIAQIHRQYSGKVKTIGKIVYMPQNVKYLFTRDRVCEEISLDIAQRLGIDDVLDSHPFDLSGGQAQRLALGILLEQNADILLLDEPTQALDTFSKNCLRDILKNLCKEGKTVIMVTHDLDFAGEVSDRVSFLSDGVIAMTGDRREVFSSLNFFTTQIRRITKNTLKNAVSTEDLV
ncbi:MAG: ABC transporter ATP-binding protein [Eubacterium sp.]